MKKIIRAVFPICIYVLITYVISVVSIVVIFAEMGMIMALIGKGFHDQVFLDGVLRIYEANILLITFISALAAIPVLIWLYKRDVVAERELDWIWPTKLPRYSGYLILFGIAACIGGNTLISLARPDQWSGVYQQTSYDIFGASPVLQVIGVGCVIPIAEELTFRALGFRRLRDGMSFWGAALLSSLFFGIFHGNMLQGIYAFGLGIGISYVYESYHTLLAPILVHSVANLTSIILSRTSLSTLLFGNMGVMLVTCFGALVICILSVYLIYKRVYNSNHKMIE